MQSCGLCSMLSGLFRRAMCVGSRRDSSDSYYRELGDQDTLKIDDKSVNSLDIDDNGVNDLDQDNSDSYAERPDPGSDSELLKRPSGRLELVHPQQPGCSNWHSDSSHDLSYSALANGRFLTLNNRKKKVLVTRSLILETGLLDDFHAGQTQCMLEQAMMWHFNAFILENISGGRSLPFLCVHLFNIYGLMSHFKLDYSKAWKLCSLIEEHYHSANPYHNSVHAADVTQAMHCFLQQKRIRDHIQPIEVLASLLAAMAHDIDHPGVNQPFLIATSSHLAKLYHNESVLENHHLRAAISCIIESGLLDQLKPIQKQLHGLITSLILATDITRQKEYLDRFRHYQDTETLDMRRAEHRQLVLQMALKCADISNPCRPWEVSRKWSLRVCEEFFRQGDHERRLHLPVSSLCDRHNASIPQIQTGFFKLVVNPLISEWHRFLKNDLSSQMFRNLAFNLTQWEKLLAQEVADNARRELSDDDLLLEENKQIRTTAAAALELSGAAVLPDLGEKEFLMAVRRSSLNPVRKMCFREHLRRYSVPLNIGDVEKNSRPNTPDSQSSIEYVSEASLHSNVSDDFEPHSTSSDRDQSSSEQFLLKSSTASPPTPPRDCPGARSAKLVRQQTFPPIDGPPRLVPGRSLFICDVYAKSEAGQRMDLKAKLRKFIKRSTEEREKGMGHGVQEKRRGSAPVGSQLISNMAVSAARDVDLLLPRRKSMPTETAAAGQDVKKRDLKAAIPELLRRTFSSKERSEGRRSGRRGSAPASEPRGSTARRCQQWLAKAAHGRSSLPRRSSLPVEVLLLSERTGAAGSQPSSDDNKEK